MTPLVAAVGAERLAKVIARSGLCSRRDAEGWIKDGRVAVNGTVIRTPAFNVTGRDDVVVDGVALAAREGTRVWLYHKPAGLVVTEKDPEGRPTIFEKLAAAGLPRVVTIGRLDINTEGLLLLTNDGGLKRVLELPATGWLRRYRVRAHGTVTQAALDRLKEGTEIEGVKYGPIEATFERQQGSNVWLLVALREGKNREVKNVLAALGMQVNRLIRVSYGPFQLGDIPVGQIEAVKARVLRDQLGKRLADEAGADFVSEPAVARPVQQREPSRGSTSVAIGKERFRFTDRADTVVDVKERPPRADRPGRPDLQRRPATPKAAPATGARTRKIHFDDGRESTVFEEKTYGKPVRPERGADRPPARGKDRQRTDGKERLPGRGPRGPAPPSARGPRSSAQASDKPAGRPARSATPRGPSAAPSRPRTSSAAPGKPGERPARSSAPRGKWGAPSARPRSSPPKGPRPAGGKPDRPRSPRPPRTRA